MFYDIDHLILHKWCTFDDVVKNVYFQVDHTIITYLISPKGDFVNYYDRSRSADQVIDSIKRHIQKYTELERRHK